MTDKDKPLLSVQDVRFSYEKSKERRVLDGISLDISQGERIALLGASGSGKSTLLSLIGLLNVPDEGRIMFEGQEISRMSEEQRCRLRSRKLGFVFQHHFLLPELTAFENVVLAGLIAGKPVKAEKSAVNIFEHLGLSHKMKSYPRQLSGGEQQRVALARALVNKPSLILADEPTGNLDSVAGKRVLDLMDTLQREMGMALLMVTHDSAVAGTCEKRLVIKDGRLIGRNK